MLDLIWFSKFKDGSIINQFDDIKKQEKEHTFKEVLDKQDELEQFALLDLNYNHIYTVNLTNGTISVSSEGGLNLEPDEDMLRDDSIKYRLIYFRRVSRTFTADLKEVDNATITYFLGFQYNDKEGKNHKRLMKIDKYGKVLIN